MSKKFGAIHLSQHEAGQRSSNERLHPENNGEGSCHHHKRPECFHDAVPANRWLMEQKSLALTLGGLPNRPPIIFGDGFVLKGADAFEGLVPDFESADSSVAASLMNILELSRDAG